MIEQYRLKSGGLTQPICAGFMVELYSVRREGGEPVKLNPPLENGGKWKVGGFTGVLAGLARQNTPLINRFSVFFATLR